MSLQSSMAVMKAKLAGNVPQLQALAMQGDFEAVAALKEMTDKKAYAQGMANETAMGQEDTLPVLEQMVGNLDTPQSGIAAYAGGGRAFADGGTPDWAKTRPGYHANQSMYDEKLLPAPTGKEPSGTEMIGSAWQKLLDMFSQNPNYSNEHLRGPRAPGGAPAEYPEPTAVRSPETAKATVRKPSYTGIAAAGAPAEKSPPSNGAFDPAKRMQRQEGAGMPTLPAAEDQTDDELRKSLEALTTLQKERDELRGKSRAQLEAAYNAKVKNLTPSKFDRVMEFLAGVSAKGGSSAAQALGAGALSMHGKDKARQEQLASVKEMYDKADLLEQEALVRDRMKDVEGAMALRKQAADLQRQIAAQKSTENLQGAQADYYRNAKSESDMIKARAAETRAARPTGIAAGVGGAKPMTAAQRITAIQRDAAARAAADGKSLDMLEPASRDAYLQQAARAVDALAAGPGKAASPAGPSKTIKFNDIPGV